MCDVCLLIPIVICCCTSPLNDEICRRFMKLLCRCLESESSLVSSVAYYVVYYSRAESVQGISLMLCAACYKEYGGTP